MPPLLAPDITPGCAGSTCRTGKAAGRLVIARYDQQPLKPDELLQTRYVISAVMPASRRSVYELAAFAEFADHLPSRAIV
jgi:hypothetical protein